MAESDYKDRIARKRASIEKAQAELKRLIEREQERERKETHDRRVSCAARIEEVSGSELDIEVADILGDLLALIREGGPAAEALRMEARRRHVSVTDAVGGSDASGGYEDGSDAGVE